MRSVRMGVLIGVAAAFLVTAVNIINCASATTITVEVRGDNDICDQINETGIAVTAAKDVDEAQDFVKFQSGCHDGKVGTLVITPHSSDTADRNARIGIRVVSGLDDKTANACNDADGKVGPNCILAKRTIQFVEGSDVPVTVTLNGRCVNYACPPHTTCNPNEPDPDPAKRCVAPDKVPPPPPPGDEDVHPQDDGGPGNPDADSGPLTPKEICEAKDGHVWVPSFNQCKIPCGAAGEDCTKPGACPPGVNCLFLCAGEKGCENVNCTGSGTCELNCTADSADLCKDISCDAGACKVTCAAHENACNGVLLVGKSNVMTCSRTGDGKPTCDDVRCVPGPTGKCERTCDLVDGCGPKAVCDAGDCSQFADGGL